MESRTGWPFPKGLCHILVTVSHGLVVRSVFCWIDISASIIFPGEGHPGFSSFGQTA